MKSVLRRSGALVVALSLAGCAQPAPSPQPVEPPDTRAADEAAIRAASKDWSAAAQAKDVEKFASYYTEDAVVILEAAPDVKGLAAIRQTLGGMMQDPNFALSFETTSVEVARSGDLAYELATYSLTLSNPKTKMPATQKGFGVVVWRKTGGQWKAVVDAPVSDPPA
ncbi:MAG TPA: SgcJ/EcaC family oxidoreductase [Vicinamibacteria bacterium]|nr:SgcJ/EcaC family oxidoreductase [Vicinamibacteria bacterium]